MTNRSFEVNSYIGGGDFQPVLVSVDGELREINSRGGLFGSDIRVGTERPYLGTLLIPIWESVVGLAAIHDGSYQVRRYDQKYLVYRVFDSVYDAIRYTYHLLEEKYGRTFSEGEKGRMLEAAQLLQKHNSIAAGLCQDNADQVGRQFFTLARRILAQIEEKPRDEHKKRARNMTVALATVHDSLERLNQSSKMTLSTGALGRIRKRTFNISCIEPHIMMRRAVLKALTEQMELYLEGVYNFLSILFAPGADVRRTLMTRATRASIVRQMQFYADQIATFDVHPFRRTGAYIEKEFRHVQFYLKNYQYQPAIQFLQRGWNSLLLRQVRTEVEDIMLQILLMQIDSPTRVDATQCDALIYRTKRQADMLKTVDETGFKHPVADAARSYLDNAALLLVQKDWLAVRDAQAALKSAASYL